MSNFYCEHCGKAIIDSPHGYTTSCEHYSSERAERVLVGQAEIKRKVKLWTKQNKLNGGK